MSLAVTHRVPTPGFSTREQARYARQHRSLSLRVVGNSDQFRFHALKDCECFDVHQELVPYRKAWACQQSIVNEKKASIERNEDCPETLIVLEHEEFLNFNLKDSPLKCIGPSVAAKLHFTVRGR